MGAEGAVNILYRKAEGEEKAQAMKATMNSSQILIEQPN